MSRIKELKIKNSWDDITINEFYDIQNILTKYAEQENNELVELEVRLTLLSILSGEPVSFFEGLSIQQITPLYKHLEFIIQLTNIYDIKGNIQDVYVIGDTHYKFIKNINEITTGQFIDLQQFIKSNNQLEILANTHLICSTVLLPIVEIKKSVFGPDKIITEKYGETSYDTTWSNILQNMKITDALGISVFFYTLFLALQKATQIYSEKKLKKMVPSLLKNLKSKEMKNKIKLLNLDNNGDGLQPLIESLEEIERNGISSLNLK